MRLLFDSLALFLWIICYQTEPVCVAIGLFLYLTLIPTPCRRNPPCLRP